MFLTCGIRSWDAWWKKSTWFRHLFRIIGRKHDHTFPLADTQSSTSHTLVVAPIPAVLETYVRSCSRRQTWLLMCQRATSSIRKLKSLEDQWAEQIKWAQLVLSLSFHFFFHFFCDAVQSVIPWYQQGAGSRNPIYIPSPSYKTAQYLHRTHTRSPIHFFFLTWWIELYFFIEVWLIYNVAFISVLQQSDSLIHIHMLFHILLHHSLSQDIGYSSLCYTVGPCCLSIL